MVRRSVLASELNVYLVLCDYGSMAILFLFSSSPWRIGNRWQNHTLWIHFCHLHQSGCIAILFLTHTSRQTHTQKKWIITYSMQMTIYYDKRSHIARHNRLIIEHIDCPAWGACEYSIEKRKKTKSNQNVHNSLKMEYLALPFNVTFGLTIIIIVVFFLSFKKKANKTKEMGCKQIKYCVHGNECHWFVNFMWNRNVWDDFCIIIVSSFENKKKCRSIGSHERSSSLA